MEMQTFDEWFGSLAGHEKISRMDRALMRAAWDAALMAVLQDRYAQMRAAA